MEVENGVRYLHDARDVSEDVLTQAEKVFEDWFDNDEPIDWETFIDRLADPKGYGNAGKFDFKHYDSPAIRKIQRHVRKYRDEG